jgi:peroxiredoxin
MLAGLVLTTALAIGALAVAASAAPQAGKPAPEFVGRDKDGNEVRLSSLKGKTVVLEWTNEGCPYVRKHYGAGNMQALQAEAAAKDVVWITVQSSAPGTQGHVNGLEAQKWIDDNKARPSYFLLDPDGKIGRLFDARTTPHMFVIDKEGVLQYMGGIDDKATSNPADIKGARNYVREAIAAVTAGKPMSPASTRPYGCSVKYSGRSS